MNKIIVTILFSLLTASPSFAHMDMCGSGKQGNSGDCWDWGGGHMGGGMCCGPGFGTGGAGHMVPGMRGYILTNNYLDTLNPISGVDNARTAFQAFIDYAKSTLKIGEIWEYGVAFKAELVDTNGAKAFDLLADKFTGIVTPEMGMSMMLNASYGKGIYKTPKFGKKLKVTPDEAMTIAQDFVTKNSLGYTLDAPETYPGFYKFHTTTANAFGLDIMVNGYNGGVWMNTILGAPLKKF